MIDIFLLLIIFAHKHERAIRTGYGIHSLELLSGWYSLHSSSEDSKVLPSLRSRCLPLHKCLVLLNLALFGFGLTFLFLLFLGWLDFGFQWDWRAWWLIKNYTIAWLVLNMAFIFIFRGCLIAQINRWCGKQLARTAKLSLFVDSDTLHRAFTSRPWSDRWEAIVSLLDLDTLLLTLRGLLYTCLIGTLTSASSNNFLRRMLVDLPLYGLHNLTHVLAPRLFLNLSIPEPPLSHTQNRSPIGLWAINLLALEYFLILWVSFEFLKDGLTIWIIRGGRHGLGWGGILKQGALVKGHYHALLVIEQDLAECFDALSIPCLIDNIQVFSDSTFAFEEQPL